MYHKNILVYCENNSYVSWSDLWDSRRLRLKFILYIYLYLIGFVASSAQPTRTPCIANNDGCEFGRIITSPYIYIYRYVLYNNTFRLFLFRPKQKILLCPLALWNYKPWFQDEIRSHRPRKHVRVLGVSATVWRDYSLYI